jgi:hypothetical protein
MSINKLFFEFGALYARFWVRRVLALEIAHEFLGFIGFLDLRIAEMDFGTLKFGYGYKK